MTDEELDRLANKLIELGVPYTAKTTKKSKRKGLFSKVIVVLCVFLAIAYTAICLLMQWAKGIQPEPQLTITFLGLVGTELVSLAAIKRGKDKTK